MSFFLVAVLTWTMLDSSLRRRAFIAARADGREGRAREQFSRAQGPRNMEKRVWPENRQHVDEFEVRPFCQVAFRYASYFFSFFFDSS